MVGGKGNGARGGRGLRVARGEDDRAAMVKSVSMLCAQANCLIRKPAVSHGITEASRMKMV